MLNLMFASAIALTHSQDIAPTWKVGIACLKITPEQPVFLAGYASRDKPFAKVTTDLFAKALVLEDAKGQRAVIVTSDLLGFPAAIAEPVCERISEKTGLRREQILISSSHTHTGPTIRLDPTPRGAMSAEDAARTVAYTKQLQDKVVDVVVSAVSNLQPARLSFGHGVVNFVMNRREFTPDGVILGVNPRGPVDRSVPVLRVDSTNGQPIAILFGAACHNTTLGPQHYDVTGDYAGFAQEIVKQRYPAAQAMFMIGCAGDANPYPRGTIELARQHGDELAREVFRVVESKLKPIHGPLKVALGTASLPQQRLARDDVERRAATRGVLGDIARQMLDTLSRGERLSDHYNAPVAVWQFGDDLTLVGLPGEIVADYVFLLEKALGPLNVWIAAYCNDVFGYLPSARMLDEGGYEMRGVYSGGPGFFALEVQDALVNRVRELAASVGRALPQRSVAVAPPTTPVPVRGGGPPPKIILIGDSIRMGYAPLVAERIGGKAAIVSYDENGGDSSNVLKHLDEWVIRQQPALVHLNCGLHDLKLDRTSKRYQVEIKQYEANLREIVARIRGAGIPLIFATTTPIEDERHAKRGGGFDRFNADVDRYNKVALAVMREAGVVVHDLNWLVHQHDSRTMLGTDGTHFTPEANSILSAAVSDCVMRQLSVIRHVNRSDVGSGPEAAEAYRREEARRDGLVPPPFKDMKIGRFAPPKDARDWKSRRPDVLRKVIASLGDLPPRPSTLKTRVVSRELRTGYVIERVGIDNGADSEISALLLIPEKTVKQAPAVLWLHSSTPDKNQIITPNTEGGEMPLGEALVRAGYVVMAPDAYWHGDRAGTGPAGAAESLSDEHNSLFKLNLWMGRTLWGMFVRDDQIALDYLCSRPEVDASRIGVTGMSMGSTRAWWLAALDERIAAVVGMACLTRYQNLIQHGQLRQHGAYYFTYGLLKHFDSEAVISLVAPRAALFLTGELNAGSPADGIREIEKQVRTVYEAIGAHDRFRNVLYPEVGHTVTPEMRREMMRWYEMWLR